MAAPEIHSAFRGRLVCLLVLRTPGSNLCLPPAEVSVYFLRWSGKTITFHSRLFIRGDRVIKEETFTNLASCRTKNPNDDGIMSVTFPHRSDLILAKRLLSLSLIYAFTLLPSSRTYLLFCLVECR